MEIIKWFKTNYHNIVEDMRNCSHDLATNNPSQYHAEGDVWTHTMMVYNQLKKETVELRLAALLHDIGKPSTQHIKPEKNYYSFSNHEQVSTYMAIEILNKFEKDFNENINKEIILKSINFHQDIHKLGKLIDNEYVIKEEELQFLNKKFGDFEFYTFMIKLSYADANGRICIDDDKLEKQYQFLFNYIPTETYKEHLNDKPEAVILIGPPGVGKSTISEQLIKEKDYVYLSTDSIIMEKNTKNIPYGMFWTPEKRDEAILEMDKRMLLAIQDRKNIIIDGTNIDKIARERRLSYIPDKYYKKIAINVVCSLDTIIKRNNERRKIQRDIPLDYILYLMREYDFVGEDMVHYSKVIINE